MLTDPKIIEAWFTLMAEAMKGTREAQEVFQALSKNPLNTKDMDRWFTHFMPESTTSSSQLRPEMFQKWLEEWWRMIGVVPRSRYVELLERNDELKRRLAQAQETMQKMRAALDEKAWQPQNVLDLWKTMLDETLKLQAQWASAWTGNDEKPEKGAKETGEKKGSKPS